MGFLSPDFQSSQLTGRKTRIRLPYKVFSIVFLPTFSCNCTCTHCFEKLDEQRIEDGDYEIVFIRMREMAEFLGCTKLKIYWQGGEVLSLNPDSVQKALNFAADAFRDSNILTEHHLQTNLLLYDSSKWKDVVSNFHLGTISSSIDFPNLYRRTPDLSVDEYTKAWLQKKEEAENDGFTVSVVSLPNPSTLELGAERFYRYFRDEIAIKNVQVNFPFPGNGLGLKALDLNLLAKFMSDLYKLWVASGRDLRLSPLQAMEERIFYNKNVLPCCWAYSCAESIIAIGPKGDVGQCDCWLTTFKDYSFGTLDLPYDELFCSRHRELFLSRPLQLMKHTHCGECRFWKLCYGGCPVRAMTFNGDLLTPDYYCPVYYDLFSAIWEYLDREMI